MAMKIQRHVLLLALGYLGTAAAAGGASWMAYDEYQTARDEESNLRKQVGLVDLKIGRIEELEKDVICLRENLTYAVAILPTSKEVNDFVTKLNDFADEAHLNINGLGRPADRSKNKEGFEKVTYKVEMTANFDQFLSFLNLTEGWERLVRVSKVSIKSGKWDKDQSRDDVRADISLELQAFSYPGNDDPSKLAKIQNYEKRMQQLQDEILLQRQEIQVETFAYVPNPLRRDPLIDPRRRLSDEKEGGWPFADQKAAVDVLIELTSALTELTESLKGDGVNFIRRLEIETTIDKKLADLELNLDKAMADDAVTDSALRRRIEREVRPVLLGLKQRDPNVSARATVDDLRRFEKEMTALLAEGKFDDVLKKHETIKGRVDGRTLSQEGAAILQAITATALEAEVALDFSKKVIVIKGAIVAESGSVAVINGHVLQEGDSLEDGLIVHRIATDRVEFQYRGVVLARAR